MPDDQAELIPSAYRTHLAAISEFLPAKALQLETNVSLHDGLVHLFDYRPVVTSLRLQLGVGDQQIGYGDLDLMYSGAHIDPSSVTMFEEALGDQTVQLLYDEFDGSAAACAHSFLFWPKGEATIKFTDIDWSLTPRAHRFT